MDDTLKDIKDDVKEIKRDIKEVSVTLARNTTSLELHMLRTEANEARIEKLENWTLGLLTTSILGLVGFFASKFL